MKCAGVHENDFTAHGYSRQWEVDRGLPLHACTAARWSRAYLCPRNMGPLHLETSLISVARKVSGWPKRCKLAHTFL
jgi:hypothetical protein